MGLGREAAHWGDFPNKLKSSFPGSNVFCLDLPGMGVNHRETAPMSAAATVSQIRRQAVELGFKSPPQGDEKWVVLGISLGGMIAWEWLCRYPGEIFAAALINSSLPRVNGQLDRLTKYGLMQSIRAALLAQTVEKKETAILDLVSNDRTVRRKLLASWVSIAEARPVAMTNLFRQLIAARFVSIPVDRPHDNLLLLASKGDRMVSFRCSEEIHKRWDIPLVLHPNAGHGLNGDDPEWLIAQLRAWLSEL